MATYVPISRTPIAMPTKEMAKIQLMSWVQYGVISKPIALVPRVTAISRFGWKYSNVMPPMREPTTYPILLPVKM